MANKKLNEIDIQTLHLLSTPVKTLLACGVVAAVLGISHFALFRDQFTQLDSVQQKEVTLKQTYTDKSTQAANLTTLKEELAAIRSSFNVLLKQLPTDAEIPNLIQELHQAGATNGMRMNSVTPQKPVNDGPIQVLPYNISITGKYEQLAQFSRDVGALSRIITLESLTLKSDEKNDTLILDATANTYKARSAEELAQEEKNKEQSGESNNKNKKKEK